MKFGYHTGYDRSNLTLPQSELVAPVAAANPRTIVIAVTPGPFLTSSLDGAAALLDVGLPGEQEGLAVVDVLFGDADPAGRLVHSLPNAWNEVGMTEEQYPGIPPRNDSVPAPCTYHPDPSPGGGGCHCSPTVTNYSEGLLTGYRWYLCSAGLSADGGRGGAAAATCIFGLDRCASQVRRARRGAGVSLWARALLHDVLVL